MFVVEGYNNTGIGQMVQIFLGFTAAKRIENQNYNNECCELAINEDIIIRYIYCNVSVICHF